MEVFEPQRNRGHRGVQRFSVLLCVSVSPWFNNLHAQKSIRTEISLNKEWRTIADDENKNRYRGFEQSSFNDKNWSKADVPHNWDAYEGYRRMRHGNRHGYAWYRKTFAVKQQSGKRFFLFFEGVGSYATVWLNGKQVGYHAGGRTTFTIDVTETIKLNNQPNLLAVRADNPANIRDLPWVCGGCSEERGFSEGSQPMGIFRPVQLIVTDDVRIEPFGVHIWNDKTVSKKSAQLFINSEIKNYSNQNRNIQLVNRLVDNKGIKIFETSTDTQIKPRQGLIFKQEPPLIKNPGLWSLEDPYLYTLVTEIIGDGRILDRITTPYGIRSISWSINNSGTKQFLINGKPVFINGIAEYEHLLGSSHAFTDEQIRSRVMQMKAAGFNSFRDAHHPHNLRYQDYWDSLGLTWWTQMGAHIWFDNSAFKENFKTLLKEWVKERRNSPSLIMWGLQNESKLPEEFAKECVGIIRDLDPTASSQRLITTCNGGSGTDWDVPQNWTGTYGGDPATYAEDLKKQILVGEYGAWRTLDLHTEGPFMQNGSYSENRMTALMEMKLRLAEKVRDSVAGHYMWLFTSHDNPGRVQGGEGFRELDRIGPVNYKGLLTPWEEPLDVYYMYRSNYASKEKEPMVYIVSHNWPERWTTPGKKNNIVVYSNCDEVELFNDIHSHSVEKRKNAGRGTHFQWDDVNIQYNVLYAVGYVNGKQVATDYIVLHHLPESPGFKKFLQGSKNVTAAQPGYNYLYRVNCGGGNFKDHNGNTWSADREKISNKTWGSVSWTKDFPGLSPFFASQRKTYDPIKGTVDWKIFQTFRYGREKLQYSFPVQDGEYLVELYFTEPWLGTGGGMDCTGWRIFDVAVNGKTVLKNIDIWKEAGHDGALKKMVRVKVTGGQLLINFPRVASGQALISAIAIASVDKNLKPAAAPEPILKILYVPDKNNWLVESWLDLGDQQYINDKTSFHFLPPELFGADWVKTTREIKNTGNEIATVQLTRDADLFIAIDSGVKQPSWIHDFINTTTNIENDQDKIYTVYKKRFHKEETIKLLKQGMLNNEMYLVMAIPASNIEPAYDLKTVVTYKAVNGTIKGNGLLKGQVDGKDRVIFKNGSENILEWDITIGVADMYSLTISYNNPHEKNIEGKLQLLAADGVVMKTENIIFTPTRPGKSNYISTTTGTMINAGNYVIRITAKDAEGLSINALDVQ